MGNLHLNGLCKKFHAEKFLDQEQNTPALQSEMRHKPDCGEESYKGYNRLAGRNVLITGGDSGIGRATAIAYAREEANVVIQFFPGEKKEGNEVK